MDDLGIKMYMDVHQHDYLVNYLIMHGSHIGLILIRYLFYMNYLCSQWSGHQNHPLSVNSFTESLTASSRGGAHLPVGGSLLEQLFVELWGQEIGHRVYGQRLDVLISTRPMRRINWVRLLIGCQGVAKMSVAREDKLKRTELMMSACIH